MDDDGLNMRNWGYYEPSFREHLGLQLMSPFPDHRDTKPFFSTRENPILMNPNEPTNQPPRNCLLSDPPIPMHYMRDGWIQRERLLHMLPGNPNFSILPNTSSSQIMHMVPPPLDLSKEINMSLEDNNVAVRKDTGGASGSGNTNSGGGGGDGGGLVKKRSGLCTGTQTTTSKTSRSKKPKKENGNPSVQKPKPSKRNIDVVINGIDMDVSGIPIPICSCTGAHQQCYRWGSGGWQSACCTTTISMHPLPMSTKRRGARIAGRKMSQGAFKKVLEKLASEGYNFTTPIDLKSFWAKHGTNKFVTIR